MSKVFVIMYSVYTETYSTTQVAAVCTTLERAEIWLIMERLGKAWTDISRIEGHGIKTRIVTDFSETHYSTYHIQEHKLEE